VIHVVLDTNIFRKNPHRNNLHFEAIKKLSKGGLLRVHIPYIVLREFQTQQRASCAEDLDRAISSFISLLKKPLSENVLNSIRSIKDQIVKERELILADSESQIIHWAEEIGANLYPLCMEQTSAALEAYFQGKPPLKSIKIRDDIPDSFIVQAIYKLKEKTNEMFVISEDNKIKSSFENTTSVYMFGELGEFIESDDIQDSLKEIDLIDNMQQIIEALRIHEQNSSDIKLFVKKEIGESIIWMTFDDATIPDDNHEATISAYGDAENIELDFSKVHYFGNGRLGLPFSLNIEVYAQYYIFKADYYALNPVSGRLPYVTDHNDHYFEAEEEFNLLVSGLISIALDRDNIDINDIGMCILDGCTKIDEINDIQKC